MSPFGSLQKQFSTFPHIMSQVSMVSINIWSFTLAINQGVY